VNLVRNDKVVWCWWHTWYSTPTITQSRW